LDAHTHNRSNWWISRSYILFHNGKSKGGKKELKHIIQKSDCVVVLLGAVGHVSMNIVKDICKKKGISLLFHNGFGASGAIQLCIDHFKQTA